MRANTVLAAALAICACKKASEPPPPAPTGPTSIADLDALWRLAPDGAFLGFVASPSALTRIEAGVAAVDKVLAAAPELAPFKARLDQELADVLGTSSASLAAVGLASKPGLAVFATGKAEAIVILPVADRDRFLAVVKGTKGTDSDTVKRATCKPVKGVYACARDAALFGRLGTGDLSARLALAGARGDIELTLAIPNTQIEVAGVAQLGPGSVVVRGAVRGAPAQVRQLLANAKPRTDGDRTAGFAVVELAGYLKALADKVPPLPLAPGVTADTLVASIAGPLTITIANGSTTIDLRLPLSDPGPATQLLAACDQLPPLARLGATVTDGSCHVSVPQLQLELDGWVDGTTLHVGKRGAPNGGGPAAAMSPVARELASGDWVIAMFGRGTMFGATAMQVPPIPLPPQVLAAIRALGMLNEVGFGVRADGDVIRGVFALRTVWSNPDDVVAKLVAISPEDVLQGNAGAHGKAIAAAHPRSAFANDYTTGITGLMIPASTIGMLTAVAVPAFVGYMQKSKRSEADLQLARLRKVLEIHAVTNAAFPEGTVGPTPARPCCETGGRCDDPAAWQAPVWRALDFAIAEPHHYRYSYASQDGKTFVAKAIGDLDCDGEEAEYVMSGTLDARGNPQIEIATPARGE